MSSRVKVSRNDPCPCGSGRKYKRCCYAKGAPLVQGPDGELAHELPIGPDAAVTKAMEQAGVAPQVIYAFRKTGRIITEENANFVPAAALEAWQHAIDEYDVLMEGQETERQ
jgi:hypothetical protein